MEHPFPRIGFGTFRLKQDLVTQPLLFALSLGYTHIDTASIYANESTIGTLLSTYPSPRSSLFLTSKLSPYDLKAPRAALLKSLNDLKVKYLDCYLIHWPGVARKPPASPLHRELRAAAWEVLNEAKRDGLLKSIGVSNFTPAHIRELQASKWGVEGLVVQMEIHPWYWRDAMEIQTLFRAEGVKVVGYGLLGEGLVLGEDGKVLERIAERVGGSRVQIVLAWALKKGFGVLARSENEVHLKDNLEAEKFAERLTSEDCAFIDGLTTKETERKMCWDPRGVL